ncbi:hypothetical protein B0I37DRAFT_176721 [Chaetomium sp. MPI-CAGE-AT-0009]|nr:hypothetical protein B0I37DRAFT_176721 [Chaetomium sp. MPI-CAGE-AT-0009]
MESFTLLRRRTTELFNSMPAVPSMPAMPAMPSLGGRGSGMKGTWEKLQIPPLPRSSHSADVVGGTLYIFGGEVEPRRPVDNDMHAIRLPSSGAQADYYAIKAKPANPSARAGNLPVPIVKEPKPASDAGSDEEDDEDDDDDDDDDDDEEDDDDDDDEDSDEDSDEEDDKKLSEVPLTTPSPGPGASTSTSASASANAKGKSIAPAPRPELADVPAPRVGHATAVIGHRIFLFGGRGGPDMAPLDEGGRVWVFDTRTHLWSFLDPCPAAAGLPDIPRPAPRSYHAAVATAKPDNFAKPGARPRAQSKAEAWRDWALGTSAEAEQTHGIPQQPVVGVLAERATDADADGYGTVIIHGGCLAEPGARAADVWAFDVRSRVWQRLPDAPGAGRGGASLALGGGGGGRLYRFGGFDGEAQAGGQLDFLELGVDTFDDQVSRGEVVLCARGRGAWKTLLFYGNEDVGYKEVDPALRPLQSQRSASASASAADGVDASAWPGNRSVAVLEAVTVGGGREYLVLMFGEREASGAGHAAAGRFWDDVWAFQVPSEGMSLASVADTAFSVVGRKNGEGTWTKVETGPHDDEDDASAEGPGPRGWVASATMGELENGIVVFGGLNEGNRRLGDGWILRLG